MKTSNVEGHGSKAVDATRGRRSTLLAGSKGQVWRDPVTESVGQIRDMTVVGLTFVDNEDGTGVLIAGDGTGGGLPGEDDGSTTLPDVHAVITADVSNPPTQGELEAAIGSMASAVPGQAYLVIDSDTALGYRVWSTGAAFDFVPVVSPASDLAVVGSGIFNDFHGQWSAAQYDATSATLFFTYLNAASDAVISSWDGAILTSFTLHAALDPGDLHAQPALLIRSSDRKIIVAYSAHIGANVYTRISTNAADVSAWGSETDRDAAIGGTDYTYHILFELSDGIYWFMRTYTGTTPGGQFNHAGAIWSYTKSTDDGATWSTRVNVMSNATYGMYWMPSKTSDVRVDFLACDRSTFDATGGSLFHMYMVGGTFYTTDGTEITATKPFDETAMTQVWESDGTQAADPGQVILGSDTHPRALFHEFEDISPEDGRYYWNRYDGSAWGTAVEVAAAGVGAPRATTVFADGDPYTVFYTKDVSNVSQVYKAVTADEGVTWLHAAVTAAGNDHSRLVTVRDGPANIPVLWLANYIDDTTNADITGGSWAPSTGAQEQRVVIRNGESASASLAELIWRISTTGALEFSIDFGTTWYGANSGIDGGGGGHFHAVGESFVGDGAQTVFYLAQEAELDSVAAYNGSGARVSITQDTTELDKITFAAAPAAGTGWFDYIPATEV